MSYLKSGFQTLCCGLLVLVIGCAAEQAPVETSTIPTPGLADRFPEIGSAWAQAPGRAEIAEDDPAMTPRTSRIIRLDELIDEAIITGAPPSDVEHTIELRLSDAERFAHRSANGGYNLAWSFQNLDFDATEVGNIRIVLQSKSVPIGQLELRWEYDCPTRQQFFLHKEVFRVPLVKQLQASYNLSLLEIRSHRRLSHLAVLIRNQPEPDDIELQSLALLTPLERFKGAAAGVGYEQFHSDYRSVVYQWSTSDLEFPVQLPPEKVDFVCAAGILANSGFVELRIVAITDGAEVELLRKQLVEQEQWVNFRASLSPFAGQKVNLRFEINAAEPTVVLWASPRIVIGDEPPELVCVYLIDALRADHVQGFAPDAPATPAIVELMKRGTSFQLAMANAPVTQYSLPTLMTGRLPANTGVIDLGHVPDSVPTLAELLRQAGFTTVSLLCNSHGGIHTNLHRGFDQAIHYPAFNEGPCADGSLPNGSYDNTCTATDILLEYLDQLLTNYAGEDLFIYMHLMEPHQPYIPAPEFREEFAAVLATHGATPPADGATIRDNLKGWMTGESPTGRWPADVVTALYRGAVQTADQTFGRAMAIFERHDAPDDMVVLLCSDHGEHMMEHPKDRVFIHNAPMFMPTMRVPLVLVAPGRVPANARVSVPVQLADVTPTLLELLRVPTKATNRMVGDSLLHTFDEPQPTWFGERTIVSQIEGQWSILAAPYHVPDLNQEPIKVFHVGDDPLELSPLRGEALADALAVILSRLPLVPFFELETDADAQVFWDRNTEDQLRALGYIE